uniref:PXA1 n=1 Tax=Arundo donax TaxID=35708 RepID=A0A0A9CK77_ARUDO
MLISSREGSVCHSDQSFLAEWQLGNAKISAHSFSALFQPTYRRHHFGSTRPHSWPVHRLGYHNFLPDAFSAGSGLTGHTPKPHRQAARRKQLQ